MRRLYSVAISCAAPFAFAVVLWRGLRDRSYWQGLAERFGYGPPVSAPTVWLHAVSLGEMSAAAPLIRGIRARYPQLPLLLTTATPAGRGRARALFGDMVDIRFLPYDTAGSVRRFLARIEPRLAIIMETELWPNLFRQCARRGVPVVLASARLSAKSVSRYRRLGKLFSGVFTANVLVAAQSAEDAERFQSIGSAQSRTHVSGNVKFDLQLDPGILDQGRRLRYDYGGARPVWIAGSTHAGEEEQVLEAHARLLADRPNALLLLVPRHKDRFVAVAELLARRGLRFARRSSSAVPAADGSEVLLVDTVGELARLYASADVAFVGGSLVPIGGHNLLEPAALGLPVLTGPFQFNSREIATLLLRRGAALEVSDARELAAAVRRLFDDPGERQRIGAIGRDIVASNRGSVARLLALMEPWLAARP
ncbi:MAG TPA: lipid IV(A) 3-deoxy-D-manno-octulosonic acid transferase [Steroidobacteraceae bacterium]|nr:lipid IV(A) 3-deoxy-D-manno-octulosonic acid transferase [Steroidobacteraceae bacterium]